MRGKVKISLILFFNVSGTKGGLANRQLPSGKKSLSNSSSEYGLNGSEGEDGVHKQDEYVGTNAQENTSRISYQYSQQTSSNSHVNSHSGFSSFRTDSIYSHATHTPASQPLHVATQDSWSSLSYSKNPKSSYGSTPPKHPASLAEQLKQVLAERERRLSTGESPPRDDFESSRVPPSLAEEIRQAVNEANAKVKKVPIPQNLVPPSVMPWQQQVSPLREVPPSPSTISSSGSVSPGGATGDSLPGSDSSELWCSPHDMGYSGKGSGHFWQTAPVTEWSKEQVRPEITNPPLKN